VGGASHKDGHHDATMVDLSDSSSSILRFTELRRMSRSALLSGCVSKHAAREMDRANPREQSHTGTPYRLVKRGQLAAQRIQQAAFDVRLVEKHLAALCTADAHWLGRC
jgi:hypothetical protein